MEEKKINKLFMLIGGIILLLNFIFMILYFSFLTKKHCPYWLKEKILDYIHKNNLKESDYNFDKVFWTSSEGQNLSRELHKVMILILYIISTIILIIGFIFYIIYLLKRKSFAIIISTILFIVALIPLIFDLIYTFENKKTLTNKDLSDFGELNDYINKAYNSVITSRIIMKISSIFLFISPFYYIISPFIVVRCLLNNKKNNEPKEQPIIPFDTNEDKTL